MAEFKTSFIPKKPIVSVERRGKIKRGRGIGLVGFISFIIFLVSLITSGGLFLYKAFLERNIESISGSLDRVKEAIEPESIRELVEADSRIETAQLLLDTHKIISPIFRLLEGSTLQTVRFSRFDYTISEEKNIKLVLSGEARDYLSLAFQSDIFDDVEGMEEPIFSNLSLNDRGNVSFNLTTPINSSFILYRNNLNNKVPGFVEIIEVVPIREEESITEDTILLEETVDLNEDDTNNLP